MLLVDPSFDTNLSFSLFLSLSFSPSVSLSFSLSFAVFYLSVCFSFQKGCVCVCDLNIILAYVVEFKLVNVI